MMFKIASTSALLAFFLFVSATAVAQPPTHQIRELETGALGAVARGLGVGERLWVEQARLLDGEEPVALDLERFEVFVDDAEIHIHGDDGESIESPPNNIYLRGVVSSDDGSLVVLGLHENGEVVGLARYHGKISMLEGSSADGLLHGNLVDPNLFRNTPFECGNEQLDQALDELGSKDVLLTQALEPELEDLADLLPVTKVVTHTARVAIETDYELYTLWNNTTNLVNYVGNLFAFMSGIYESQISVNVVISYLSIYTTSADPWVETASLCGLYEFGRYWNLNRTGVSRTIAHFLSGKNTGGGVAWIGVLCRAPFNTTASGCIGISGTGSYGGGYGFTGSLSGSFNPASPTVVWDIYAISHEIGHNFNSPHTHCYNNIGGSAQPIDQCFGGESGCYGGAASLPGPQGAGSGTIMSYCHLLSGGYTNISLNFGVGHPHGVLPGRVATRMQSHVTSTARATRAVSSSGMG